MGEEVHLRDPMQEIVSIPALQRVLGSVDERAADFTAEDDEDIVMDALSAAAASAGAGITGEVEDWWNLPHVKIPGGLHR